MKYIQPVIVGMFLMTLGVEVYRKMYSVQALLGYIVLVLLLYSFSNRIKNLEKKKS